MSSNYYRSLSFTRKIAQIERQLNNKGYQTEPNERESWLGVTRYKQQSKMTYMFIMEESIDRVVTQITHSLRYA